MKLQCPECMVQETIDTTRKRSTVKRSPICCSNCNTRMQIVHKCLTCVGKGRWLTATSSVVCECLDCNGTGQLLEEQP